VYLPEGLQCVVTTEQEAEAICWEFCQNNNPDKTACFCDDCPLAQIEIRRCKEVQQFVASAKGRFFVATHVPACM